MTNLQRPLTFDLGRHLVSHWHLYLVESIRDGGRVRQRIARALGRKDVLLASRELDRLVASLAATASGQ